MEPYASSSTGATSGNVHLRTALFRAAMDDGRSLALSKAIVAAKLPSKSEGGANAVSEAIVASVPVISSWIAGSVGMLGAEYPGYYPPGDTRALARLLERAERDRHFYAALRQSIVRKAGSFTPARERASWRRLLGELRRG